MTPPAWGGRRVQEIRDLMAQQLPAPCAARTSPRCSITVTTADDLKVGHILDRATHPELTWKPTNWRIECQACSDSSGMGVRVKAAAHRAANRASPSTENRDAPQRQVTLITGPPAAGKTTHAHSLGLTVYDVDDEQWTSETEYIDAIATLAHDPHAQAAVIRTSNPHTWAKLIQATETIAINPGQAECERRARARGRNVAATIAAIRKWFDTEPVFPTEGQDRKPPPLPVSLSGDRSASLSGRSGSVASQDGQNGGKDRLAGPTGSQLLGSGSEALRSAPVASGGVVVPERLWWDPVRLARHEWLVPLLDVPPDANPPLAMTPPHPDAVDTFGWSAVEWIESRRKIRLRWWQRLAVVRQLEHDADGMLLWRVTVESAPRRAGKSERLRSVALWRLEHGVELFEPGQVVVHIGRDLAICREVQERAWPWCEAEGWQVRRGNGKEAVTHPNGARWLVKAKDAVYGFDGHAVIADECWDLAPSAISDGAEPAMLDRVSPQLTMTSTAHPDRTSLMPDRIAAGLADDDPEILLLLWSARDGADHDDPETWRSASPYWTGERRKTIASKRREALATAPSVDNPDPVGSWAAQYLNVWPRLVARVVPGDPVVGGDDWAALAVLAPVGRPDAVSVEGWPGERLSVARGWRDGDRAVVDAQDVADVASAAALVASWGVRSVSVGADMVDDPAWREHGLRASSESGSVLAAVGSLSRLLTDGVLRHTGGEHLSGQVLDLRVSPSPAGLRLRSSARSDAVKAAVRAVQAARPVGRQRIIAV